MLATHRILAVLGATTISMAGCAQSDTEAEVDADSDSGADAQADVGADALASDIVDTFDVDFHCEPGAAAERTIGGDGGSLDFCGARLVVPPDAVSEDTRFVIAVGDNPGEPPSGYVFAGVPMQFSADGPLLVNVELAVPHDPTTRPVELFQRVEEAWWSLEACEVTESTIGQWSALPVELVAATADRDYPPGPAGLGDGEIDITFNGQPFDVVLDDTDYAFHIDDASGSRSVDVNILNSLDEGVAWSFRLQMVVGPDEGGLLSVQFGDTGETGLYNYLQPVHGPPRAFGIVRNDERVEGSGEVTVYQGEGSGDLRFTFDLGTEAYRFPPELACPGGEGGDPGP